MHTAIKVFLVIFLPLTIHTHCISAINHNEEESATEEDLLTPFDTVKSIKQLAGVTKQAIISIQNQVQTQSNTLATLQWMDNFQQKTSEEINKINNDIQSICQQIHQLQTKYNNIQEQYNQMDNKFQKQLEKIIPNQQNMNHKMITHINNTQSIHEQNTHHHPSAHISTLTQGSDKDNNLQNECKYITNIAKKQLKYNEIITLDDNEKAFLLSLPEISKYNGHISESTMKQFIRNSYAYILKEIESCKNKDNKKQLEKTKNQLISWILALGNTYITDIANSPFKSQGKIGRVTLSEDEYTFIVHLNSLDKYKSSIDQDTLDMFIMNACVNCCVREEIHKKLMTQAQETLKKIEQLQ